MEIIYYVVEESLNWCKKLYIGEQHTCLKRAICAVSINRRCYGEFCVGTEYPVLERSTLCW